MWKLWILLLSATSTSKSGKSGKTKTKAKKKDRAPAYMYYGFQDLLENEEFRASLDRHWKGRDKDAARSDDEDEDSDREKSTDGGKQKKSKNVYVETVEDQYKLEKVVLLEPIYLKVNEYKKPSAQLLASEKAEAKINRSFSKAANAAGLNSEIVQIASDGGDDVHNLKNHYYIRTFMEEMLYHQKFRLLPTDQIQIDELRQFYGTDHFSILIIRNTISPVPPSTVVLNVLLGVICWPCLPVNLYFILRPKFETSALVGIFDFELRKLVYANGHVLKARDNHDIVSSMIYDLLLRAKNPNKKVNQGN
jgi:hypothetical protein